MDKKTCDARTLDPQSFSFLGREFLTWLWFRCEADGGMFPLEGGAVGVVLNDYCAMVSTGDDGEQSIVKKGSPHRARESRTALRAGKVVSAARLELARGERGFSVTITGDGLDLRSVRYPATEAAEPRDKEIEKLEAMEEVSGIVDGLYELFLQVRMTDAWSARELPAMDAWIAAGRA